MHTCKLLIPLVIFARGLLSPVIHTRDGIIRGLGGSISAAPENKSQMLPDDPIWRTNDLAAIEELSISSGRSAGSKMIGMLGAAAIFGFVLFSPKSAEAARKPQEVVQVQVAPTTTERVVALYRDYPKVSLTFTFTVLCLIFVATMRKIHYNPLYKTLPTDPPTQPTSALASATTRGGTTPTTGARSVAELRGMYSPQNTTARSAAPPPAPARVTEPDFDPIANLTKAMSQRSEEVARAAAGAPGAAPPPPARPMPPPPPVQPFKMSPNAAVYTAPAPPKGAEKAGPAAAWEWKSAPKKAPRTTLDGVSAVTKQLNNPALVAFALFNIVSGKKTAPRPKAPPPPPTPEPTTTASASVAAAPLPYPIETSTRQLSPSPPPPTAVPIETPPPELSPSPPPPTAGLPPELSPSPPPPAAEDSTTSTRSSPSAFTPPAPYTVTVDSSGSLLYKMSAVAEAKAASTPPPPVETPPSPSPVDTIASLEANLAATATSSTPPPPPVEAPPSAAPDHSATPTSSATPIPTQAASDATDVTATLKATSAARAGAANAKAIAAEARTTAEESDALVAAAMLDVEAAAAQMEASPLADL
eukprot:gene10760-17845_t